MDGGMTSHQLQQPQQHRLPTTADPSTSSAVVTVATTTDPNVAATGYYSTPAQVPPGFDHVPNPLTAHHYTPDIPTSYSSISANPNASVAAVHHPHIQQAPHRPLYPDHSDHHNPHNYTQSHHNHHHHHYQQQQQQHPFVPAGAIHHPIDHHTIDPNTAAVVSPYA
ncbi:hypothetical protein EV182_006519, partial [Spiromyces aspiralis]